MKSVIHRSEDRGLADHGWLRSRFSFSFADWFDPKRMGFGALRVLNDDEVAPKQGFGMHPHANMEIVTIVTEGAVTHTDDRGNADTTEAGEVQVMSAGTGIVHSEYNESPDAPLKLFQIWIVPDTQDLVPRYEKRQFGAFRPNEFDLLVAPAEFADLFDSALTVGQEAYIYRAQLGEGAELEYEITNPESGVYIFVVEGSVRVGGVELRSRDAVGLWDTPEASLIALEPTKLLLFQVPLEVGVYE